MQLEPGRIFHIYNRGNNREKLFYEPRNYPYFLQLYHIHVHPIAETFAYSLLPNHFHFMLRVRTDRTIGGTVPQPSRKKTSQHFSNFFNAYAKSINKAYGRRGSLFTEHFGRKAVDTERYRVTLPCYIHTNARKHRLVTDFLEHPHHSYRSILSEGHTHLLRDEMLGWYGGREGFRQAHQAYEHSKGWDIRFLENPNDDDADLTDLTGFKNLLGLKAPPPRSGSASGYPPR